ncbi:phosphotransferase family protein [Novosphingobium aquimarinum]|uniref:phosphotransferase family protein n=1 Tax=Novosphingobium aquimarinum TaxID=2682494 RepID=UPI0012EBB955|nr:phosphotransferase family protein [Novosphingobium aquimarinum]
MRRITAPGRDAALLAALVDASPKLRIEGDASEGPLSSRGLFAAALRALAAQEAAGGEGARKRISSFEDVERTVAGSSSIGESNEVDGALHETLARSEARLSDAPEHLRPQQLQALCKWEADDLLSAIAEHDGGSSDADVVDAVRLTAYLRRYLSDPTISVSVCHQLNGGFGKETYLFSVTGEKLAGDFVMRRDMAVQLIPNACHRVAAEFALVKAVGEAGFETPDLLWVDVEHPEIAGGDFIIMRRSRGQAGGNLFGADQTPSPELNDRLGNIMAALHQLPPLTGLGDLTESIRSDLWGAPAHVAVRNYLEGYLKMFRKAAHTPSPATAAVFRWLIQNVPESDTTATLVHGDIGFHNMLLDDGELVAVLDWEFAHIGHPGEDLAYAYNAGGRDLDWPRVVRAYEAAGGPVVSKRTFEYFRILMQARNAVSTNLASAKLFRGEVTDLRLLSGEFYFRPHILQSLGEMISAYGSDFGV